jgi:hypothetical protein
VGTGREEKYKIRKVFGTLPHDKHSLMLYQNIQGLQKLEDTAAEPEDGMESAGGNGPDHHLEAQTRAEHP